MTPQQADQINQMMTTLLNTEVEKRDLLAQIKDILQNNSGGAATAASPEEDHSASATKNLNAAFKNLTSSVLGIDKQFASLAKLVTTTMKSFVAIPKALATAFKAVGQATTSVIQLGFKGLKDLGKVFGPVVALIGTIAIAYVTYHVALVAAYVALKKFVTALVESRREFAAVNGTWAAAFARLDVNRIFRTMQTATATSRRGVDLISALDRLEKAFQPVRAFLSNLMNQIGTKIANYLTKVFEDPKFVDNLIDGITMVLDAVIGLITGINDIADWIQKLIASISGFAKGIGDFIKGLNEAITKFLGHDPLAGFKAQEWNPFKKGFWIPPKGGLLDQGLKGLGVNLDALRGAQKPDEGFWFGGGHLDWFKDFVKELRLQRKVLHGIWDEAKKANANNQVQQGPWDAFMQGGGWHNPAWLQQMRAQGMQQNFAQGVPDRPGARPMMGGHETPAEKRRRLLAINKNRLPPHQPHIPRKGAPPPRPGVINVPGFGPVNPGN